MKTCYLIHKLTNPIHKRRIFSRYERVDVAGQMEFLRIAARRRRQSTGSISEESTRRQYIQPQLLAARRLRTYHTSRNDGRHVERRSPRFAARLTRSFILYVHSKALVYRNGTNHHSNFIINRSNKRISVSLSCWQLLGREHRSNGQKIGCHYIPWIIRVGHTATLSVIAWSCSYQISLLPANLYGCLGHSIEVCSLFSS